MSKSREDRVLKRMLKTPPKPHAPLNPLKIESRKERKARLKENAASASKADASSS